MWPRLEKNLALLLSTCGYRVNLRHGEYPQMTLEQARKERADAREKVKLGINPAQERRDTKLEVIEKERAARAKLEHSCEAVALDWINHQKDRWSKDHAGAIRATLELDAFPALGSLPVDTILISRTGSLGLGAACQWKKD